MLLMSMAAADKRACKHHCPGAYSGWIETFGWFTMFEMESIR